MFPPRLPHIRPLVGAGAAAVLALSAAPSMAVTWVLYDDFSTTNLSASKWSGEEARQAGGLRMEARRAIVSGQARLETRDYGDKARDLGISNARNSLLMAKPHLVTAMKSTITMRSASVAHCAANTDPDSTSGQVRARMLGFFFNMGTPLAGSSMNDVFATIAVYRNSNSSDPANTYRVLGNILVCTDDACVNSERLAGGDILTGVALNTPVTVSITWDAANKAFKYNANGTALTLKYTASDSMPPSNPNKRLEVSNNMQVCSAGRILASTSADFDNVYVNSEAAAAIQQADDAELAR